MTSTTAELLRQRNRKTIWLKEQLDEQGNVEVVRGQPGEGLPFEVIRVHGDQIGQAAMQALLGDDEYVRFANWYSKHGADALAGAKASKAKVTDPKPFDDTPPVNEDYNAHMLALTRVMRRAVLREGMAEPTLAEMGNDLGLYERPLYDALRTFGRELVTTDPKSSSSSSGPP